MFSTLVLEKLNSFEEGVDLAWGFRKVKIFLLPCFTCIHRVNFIHHVSILLWVTKQWSRKCWHDTRLSQDLVHSLNILPCAPWSCDIVPWFHYSPSLFKGSLLTYKVCFTTFLSLSFVKSQQYTSSHCRGRGRVSSIFAAEETGVFYR